MNMSNNCRNCRFDYMSYHCRDCNDYTGNVDDCGTFCKYCNRHYGDDACNNCVYYVLDEGCVE